MHLSRALAPLSLATTLILTGCGSRDEASRVPLVPVTGTVTLNGKPLGGAVVSFVPEMNLETGTAGADATGPEGTYAAKFQGRPGLAPGKYKVFVSKASTSPTESAAPDEDPYMAQIAPPTSAQKPGAKKVEDTFDREVPDSGAVLNFEVTERPIPLPPPKPRRR